jgi:hypothetical protein
MRHVWSILTSDPDRNRGRRLLVFTVIPFLVWSIFMFRLAIWWDIPPWSWLTFGVVVLLVGAADLLPPSWRREAVVLRLLGTVSFVGLGVPLHIATVMVLWHGGHG